MGWILSLAFVSILFIKLEARGQGLGQCDQAFQLTELERFSCQKALPVLEKLSDCPDPKICCQQLEWFIGHHCYCDSAFSQISQGQLAQHQRECSEFLNKGGREESLSGVRLFVGVLTAAKNHRARQAIRDTWGSHPQIHRLLFFSAKPSSTRTFTSLRREAATKQDIVLLPTIWESYHNITHQTLEVLRFAAADPVATHVLKADDDSYVRIDMLLERMSTAPATRLFMGAIENPGGGPHRNPHSPWYVTPEEWPGETYPPWAHGAGYIISQDIVREIAAGAAVLSSNHALFKLEDISVGQWVEFVGRERQWDINYVSDFVFNYNGCEPGDIVSHYIKPATMPCMFNKQGACCQKRSSANPRLRGGSLD